MINRRTYVDDGRGVDEPLDERGPNNPSPGLRLLYSNTDLEQRLASDELETPLHWFLSSQTLTSPLLLFLPSPTLPIPSFSVPPNIHIRFRRVDSLRIQNLHSDEPFFLNIDNFLSSYNLKHFSITELSLFIESILLFSIFLFQKMVLRISFPKTRFLELIHLQQQPVARFPNKNF